MFKVNHTGLRCTPTCISPCRERAYDPQTSTYDPSRSHLRPSNPLAGSVPMTRKPPSATLPGHTHTTLKSRTWREEKRESRRMDKARKGGRTKKHTRVNGVFRLTMHSACKTKTAKTAKTEKDRERQRKTEKERERQKATHTH